MRTPGEHQHNLLVTSETSEQVRGTDRMYSSSLTYHELADIPVQETDLLEQLEANMKRLGDLQARMKFMMKEIRYLMKV